MNLSNVFDILSDLLTGKNIARERIFTETFQTMLDRRMVAIVDYEPVITEAGRLFHAELDRKRKAANKRRASNARARNQVYRDLGMKRTKEGWE